jgi:hypothetical protein
VRERFGVSDMWVWRHMRDHGFPQGREIRRPHQRPSLAASLLLSRRPACEAVEVLEPDNGLTGFVPQAGFESCDPIIRCVLTSLIFHMECWYTFVLHSSEREGANLLI